MPLTLQTASLTLGLMEDSGPRNIASPDAPVFDLRRARRAKIARQLRVRPSEPRDDHFEDISTSANASKHGIYFLTRRSNYYKGMRVFVTFPYASAHDPMNCEYLAEVVRVETLANKKFGVAVDLKMTLNMNATDKPGARL